MNDSVPQSSSPAPDPARVGGFVGAHWPGSLMEAMRMEVLEHSPERTVVEMPVEGNTQSLGILHGGASAALAETAASFAAQIHARRVFGAERGFAVGTELSISHISSVDSGRVRAVTEAVRLGGSQTVHLVEIRTLEGGLVSTARVTNRILARRSRDSDGE